MRKAVAAVADGDGGDDGGGGDGPLIAVPGQAVVAVAPVDQGWNAVSIQWLR